MYSSLGGRILHLSVPLSRMYTLSTNQSDCTLSTTNHPMHLGKKLNPKAIIQIEGICRVESSWFVVATELEADLGFLWLPHVFCVAKVLT